MRLNSSSLNDFPVYDSKIYEFDEKDEAGLKGFLNNNPNLECLIQIGLDRGEIDSDDEDKEPIKKCYFHSQILLYSLKNNKFEYLKR